MMMQKYYPMTVEERDAWKELLRACSDNDVERVHKLLDEGVDLNYQDLEYRTSPFFEAIHAGHWRCVQLLMSSGASLTAVEDLTGMTPLQVALHERQHIIVDVLLERLASRHRRGINLDPCVWTIEEGRFAVSGGDRSHSAGG
jgi:ankyrin repeat protein